MGFMSVSDEVIAIIFAYTSSKDKCSLALTCRRFNDILCEKKLVRNVDLKYCLLPFPIMKHFFSMKLRCENISTLDLSSCYWLTSEEIFTSVMKMRQLSSLYVVDTKLSFSHLQRLLEILSKLENLSFSWDFDAADFRLSKIIHKQLSCLKFLYIYLPNDSYFFHQLRRFLQFCSALEELWILSHFVKTTRSVYQFKFILLMMFEHLHTLVVSVDDFMYTTGEYYLYKTALHSAQSWKIFWVSNTKYVTEDMPILFSQSKLEALQLNSNDYFPKDIQHLKYLCITNQVSNELNVQLAHSKVTHLYMSTSWVPSEFPHCLKTLVLTHCSCTGNKTVLKSIVTIDCLEELSCKLCVFFSDDDTKLQNNIQFLANRCQYLKVLSIKGCSKIDHKEINMNHLDAISCLIHLKELTLSDMSLVRDGKFFVKITSNCHKLERLSLKNIGSPTHCVYLNDLAVALRTCNQLKDFRFEHSNMGQAVNLFKSLECCKSIERIVLINGQNAVPFQREWIQVLFEKNCNLIVFIAEIPSFTMENARVIESSIQERFLKDRPALIIKIVNGLDAEWEKKLPVVHFVGILSSENRFVPNESNLHISRCRR